MNNTLSCNNHIDILMKKLSKLAIQLEIPKYTCLPCH